MIAMVRTTMIASSVMFSVWTLGNPPVRIDTLSVVGVAIAADGSRVSGVDIKLVAQAGGAGELASDRTSANGVFNLYVTNIGGAIGDLYVVYPKQDFDVKPLEVRVSQTGNQGWIDLRPGDLVFKALPAAAQLSTEDAAEHIASTIKTQTILLNAGLIDQKAFDANIQRRSAMIREKVRDPKVLTGDKPALGAATEAQMKDFKLKVDPAKIAIASGRAGAAAGGS